ncbi:hypothetical protein [uncultured Jatrophihabitans sp.]|uniref:hypothetical protein n=1 Tax=uncultured Jatrophihabitans sp. TaxID=1610747 RepID=UPI0035CB51F1
MAPTTAPRSSTPTSTSASATASGVRGQPPALGQRIVGRERVVAYYGAPGSGKLGVLGKTSPEQAAQSIIHRAAGFEHYGEPVLPAMELIATVARSGPGPGDTYSAPIPMAQVREYLDVAHEHHMLLILDLQPGRASFVAQAKALAPVLVDPSVGLALDPEWKVGPGGRPGNGLIGHSTAAGINAATSWLSGLVSARHLPDKLVVVHEFTASMLPDRQHITQHPGIEMVLHADGFGHPSTKVHVLQKLHFPSPPFGVGFKLFLTQDSRLMSPGEVMRLHPRPDVITYQ